MYECTVMACCFSSILLEKMSVKARTYIVMTCVEFTVNGKKCSVNCAVHWETTLYSYITHHLGLPGTKAMCRQGVCGACIVNVTAQRETSGTVETFSVNSCLVLVYSCHGWDITTIEGVGNRLQGYSVVQKRAAQFNATQCGFCTPGWVMHLHSLLNKGLTMVELENSFGCNTCRCTGFRPIIDTIKSFAVDASPELCRRVEDIEELTTCLKDKTKICDRKCSTSSDDDWSLVNYKNENDCIIINNGDTTYIKVFNVDQIFDALNTYCLESYMLLDGNTGKAVIQGFEYPSVLIDISNVASLKFYHYDQNLVLGANVALEDCLKIFKDAALTRDEFAYLGEFVKHFEVIAHIPVRQIGSLAGNIMVKHTNNAYPSDVFVLFEAIGATITIRDANGNKRTYTMINFLNIDMKGKLIVSFQLPPQGSYHIFRSFKIMPRSQNALAIVNAAFSVKLTNTSLIDSIRIVYGNISSNFNHAVKTEEYLRGKNLFNNQVLQQAVNTLNKEIVPDDNPPEASPWARKKLAIGLFYKFVLGQSPNATVYSRYRSGAELIARPLSRAKQTFQTDPRLYPLTHPVMKYEGLIQSSGEAQYVSGIPPVVNEVWAAFVLSTVYNGEIDKIDVENALKLDGVVALFTAKDIPGLNSFVSTILPLEIEDLEILAEKTVKYHGQPVAIVAACTQELAVNAATKVNVTYKNVVGKPPVLTINEGKKFSDGIFTGPTIEPKGRGTNVKKVIKGVFECKSQYHYYMEPLSCVVIPVDRGLDVYDATQWIEMTQITVAKCLNMSDKDVQVKIRRVGGAFGGKVSNNAQVACGCAIVAKALNRPCRFILPLPTNLAIVGKRLPFQCEYEVGVDNDGRIQFLNATITEDDGYSHTENLLFYVALAFPACYKTDYFNLKTYAVLTDLPSNSYVRAPGTLEGIMSIENIMEHIAFALEKDPTDVRLVNMRTEDNDLPILIETLKNQVDYDNRAKEIKTFNENNRWMKKAITINVMLYPLDYYSNYAAMVSIYRDDGTVTITTGGIELGQGVNTKAAQVCAYELGIPLENVSVIPHYSFVAANNAFTGGSIVSESVCYSIIKACGILKQRLKPIQDQMDNPTWLALIQKAAEEQIDLTATYMMNNKQPDLKKYSAFAVTILEMQLDVPTGKFQLLRCDILEDVGRSINPIIDISQIEGAYIMGLGYLTYEHLVYDKKSGALLTNHALNYEVFLAKDIPIDFRIHFRSNSRNPNGVLGAKAVGEMGVTSSHGVIYALRRCIMESRKESGYDASEWFDLVNKYIHRETTLNSYLVYHLGLPGTKAMCRQGVCGACIVNVIAQRGTSGTVESFSVNSCLVLVYSCHGWDITTIEGLGNRLQGYSEIQRRIAAYNGTQCGYCTPGWVMHLYSLIHKGLNMVQLENAFGCNTCRCTGYRPILDTIKSFAVDATTVQSQNVEDIEELSTCLKDKGKICDRKCSVSSDDDWVFVNGAKEHEIIVINCEDTTYIKVFEVEQIFHVFVIYGTESYMLIDGNTGKAIIEDFEYPQILIDISDVASLKRYYYDQNLVLGSNVSLEDCLNIFLTAASTRDEFGYLEEFAKHFDLIAQIPVRKLGSLAGNIMLKHRNPSYQSDVFLLFESMGATITIRDGLGVLTTYSMIDFLNINMQGKLIVSFQLPPEGWGHIFRSYKIMPRSQNALAIVNAAFSIKLDHRNYISTASIVYGNISGHFNHAYITENYLRGKNLFCNEVLQGAINILNNEIMPEDHPPEPSPCTRRKLAIGLFYKFVLSLTPLGIIRSRYHSGGELIVRPLSSGMQSFQTDPALYPLNQPLMKLEAVIQSSGEAQYVNSIPLRKNEVFGAFVLSTVHNGDVDVVDVAGALNMKGVLAVFTAKDIPGVNSFTFPGIQLETEYEEILADKNIKYCRQPVAIVAADTYELATNAAKKVMVSYKNVRNTPPILTIEQGKQNPDGIIAGATIEPKGRGTNVRKVVKGVFELKTQYHYYLEPMSCVVIPLDKGLEVYDATQWMDLTQISISQCLAISESDVHVKVRRLGGGFGGKLSRNAQVACACAIVAKGMNRPCRFILPMETNITITGKRLPNQCEYEVGVDDDGKIQYLNAIITEDDGFTHNENILSYVAGGFPNCYNRDYFNLKTFAILTNLPGNSFNRAPGTLEGIMSIENIMEHIACAVRKDPTDVRLVNMRTEDNDLPALIELLKTKADYATRLKIIKAFNKNNRWMKKAIKINVMLFPVEFFGNYTAMVSVYRGDATVTVTTGGIEMGQGVNTKVAQVCAYELGIPYEYVSVIPSYSFVAANNVFSGSSIVSECVCYALIKACDILKQRLKPIRDQLGNPTWVELIRKAGEEEIDLTASYMMTEKEPDLQNYSAFAVAILEVQLDVLTGRFQLNRCDVLEDAGLSTNPSIDVGQVEGAYVQGLSYLTYEHTVYDQQTGKLLTNDALSYEVFLAKDIPVDFRVHLRYNAKNPKGVLGSKAVGEMGICSSHGVIYALRQCIMESRKDSGYDPYEWIHIEIPLTTESILKALDVKPSEFLLS